MPGFSNPTQRKWIKKNGKGWQLNRKGWKYHCFPTQKAINDFIYKNQLIVFDFDDTLCPSAALAANPLPTPEDLMEVDEAACMVVRTALASGRVGIVTLSGRRAYDNHLARLPLLQALLRDSGIVTQFRMGVVEEFADGVESKIEGMKNLLRPHDFTSMLFSIGDQEVEEVACQETCKDLYHKVVCKTLRLPEDILDLAGFAGMLRRLRVRMEEMLVAKENMEGVELE